MAKRKTAKKSKKKKGKRWSQHVTETSDALTLEEGVFKLDSPKAIARSLKRSAEESHRRKLEKAKDELRALYGKD